MTRVEFIKVMEAKGYKYGCSNNHHYISIGVGVVTINDDNSLVASNPGGTFEYDSFDDYINGKCTIRESYIVKD